MVKRWPRVAGHSSGERRIAGGQKIEKKSPNNQHEKGRKNDFLHCKNCHTSVRDRNPICRRRIVTAGGADKKNRNDQTMSKVIS